MILPAWKIKNSDITCNQFLKNSKILRGARNIWGAPKNAKIMCCARMVLRLSKQVFLAAANL
jgi:hypothetical protein